MSPGRHIVLRLFIAAWAMLLSCEAAWSQIDAQYTQYWAVPAYYNPGAVGQTDFVHMTAGARLQWVGIKNAPMTFSVLADMPFKFLGRRWGAGVNLSQESMGLYRMLQAGAQLAWQRKVLKGNLSVGLQLGMINQTFKGEDIFIPEGDDAHQSADDAIPKTTVAGTAFDVNLGVFYTHKWFWASLSVTHLTSPTITIKTSSEEDAVYEFDAGRVLYFMAGSNIPIKNTLFEIQPSVMVKSDFQFFQAEATARVRYNKFLSVGVGYRYRDAVSVMVAAEFKNIFLGYSYDYPLSAISRATHGSHEVFAGYNVKLDLGEKNKNKHKSIRLL